MQMQQQRSPIKQDPTDSSESQHPQQQKQQYQPHQQRQTQPQLQAYHLATVAPRGEHVQVSLNNAATWRKFSRQNTEMIVTKAGRRMFPSLSLSIRGLDPAKKYELYVTLLLADQHTLKYQRGLWIPNGPGETYPPPGSSTGLVYLHPDSPGTGRQWTKQEVTFMKLKLTNKLDGFEDPSRNGSMIFVYSMHKYLPVVHISEVAAAPTTAVKAEAGASSGGDRFYTSVVFPGTEFITVTAYQNPELTDLKIQFNPYAKGIRNQTDRSGALLIDTFRPPQMPALQPQPHHQQHQQHQQHHQEPLDLHHQLHHQPSLMEFGSYPNQSASAYGHWQQHHHHPAAIAASSRRHQPYSLPVPAAPSSLDRQSPDDSAVSAAAQYPSQHYSYQQPHHQHHHSLYYGQYYSQQHQEQQLAIDYQSTQQLQQQPLTPPPPPLSAAALTQATPQGGCSLLASSSSHITESSPSGLSFNSPEQQ